MTNNRINVIISESKDNLIVHHVKNYSDILDETLYDLGLTIKSSISDYSKEELLSIENLLIEKHYEYGLGIVMTKEIHSLFHKTYGFKNNNLNQILEFKENYKNGFYYI